jgi:hypothetical protein
MEVEQYVGKLEYSSGGVRLSMDFLWQLRMTDEEVVHWWKDGCHRKIKVVGENLSWRHFEIQTSNIDALRLNPSLP